MNLVALVEIWVFFVCHIRIRKAMTTEQSVTLSTEEVYRTGDN